MSVHTGCCCNAWLARSEGHPAREGVYLPKIASHTCSGHVQAVPGAHSWSICLGFALCSRPAGWHIPHLREGLC